MRPYATLHVMDALVIRDTHKLIASLQKRGFTAQQAEGITEAIMEIDASELATKADLRELKIDRVKWLSGSSSPTTSVPPPSPSRFSNYSLRETGHRRAHGFDAVVEPSAFNGAAAVSLSTLQPLRSGRAGGAGWIAQRKNGSAMAAGRTATTDFPHPPRLRMAITVQGLLLEVLRAVAQLGYGFVYLSCIPQCASSRLQGTPSTAECRLSLLYRRGRLL